jgi:hydrogenase nickel incorporation protein HypB
MKKQEVMVLEDLLGSNKKIAGDIRKKLSEKGILAINLLSSPGAGKTSLLEKLSEVLSPGYKMAVIEGDIETERDAERIRAKGIQAWQISTGGACHLDAKMVGKVFSEVPADLDFLFIENVGNLVCPASFDLGESLRCVLLSIPEGDDKPKKYPKAFFTSDALIISKTDLLDKMPFNVNRAVQESLDVNPKLEVFKISSVEGTGISEFVDYLIKNLEKLRRSNA